MSATKAEGASPKKWSPTRCTQETRESPKRDLCPSKSSLPNPKGTGHSRGHPKVNNPQGMREKELCKASSWVGAQKEEGKSTESQGATWTGPETRQTGDKTGERPGQEGKVSSRFRLVSQVKESVALRTKDQTDRPRHQTNTPKPGQEAKFPRDLRRVVSDFGYVPLAEPASEGECGSLPERRHPCGPWPDRFRLDGTVWLFV